MNVTYGETTTLRKWGNGQGVRFNKSILERMGLMTGDSLSIEIVNQAIVMKKINKPIKHRTLRERFAGYGGMYKTTEWETGSPKGEEEF